MAKRNVNDEKIVKLQAQIAEKKKALGVNKFTPITNCSMELRGNRHNLHVQNKNMLQGLLIELNALKISQDQLGIQDYELSGYTIEDWMTDIKARLVIVDRKDEEAKLKKMEATLRTLLSADKKAELAIEEIENML